MHNWSRFPVGIAIIITLAVVGVLSWRGLAPGRPDLDRRDDVIRVGIYALPPGQGSPLRLLGPPGIFIASAIFDTLVEVAPGGVPTPALAVSWDHEAPDRWRFSLRPGVVFSNGEAMDAAAVVSSFRRVMDLSQPTVLSSLVAIVASVERVDDLTVEFATKRPVASLPTDIAGVWIVPPGAWQQKGEVEFAKSPVGSGPFVVSRWTANEVALVANPLSWRRPMVAGLTFIEVPDDSARLSAFLSGAIDVAIQTSPDGFDAIAGAGGRVLATPAGTVYTLALNTERPGSPFADVRVRRAMNYAVDKDQIARVLYRGRVQPSGQPASSITAGFDPKIAPYPYDPARARALLAEAGYAGGFDLVVEVVTNAIPADAATFSAVARDLAVVGIRAEVRSVPLPVFFARLFDNSLEGLAFQLGFISMPNLDTVKAMADFSCDKPGSHPFACLPDVQVLVEHARAELDPSARAALMATINRAAHDQALALFLNDAVDLIAVSARVAGDAPATRYYHWERFTLHH